MAAPSITGRYDSCPDRRSDPAVQCRALDGEKSDTVDLTGGPTRSIFCNGAGAAKMTFIGNADDAPVTLTLVAGQYYPFAIKRLWSTGLVAVVFGLN